MDAPPQTLELRPKRANDRRQDHLHPLFDAYLGHLQRRARDPKTIERNRYSLRRLHRWLDALSIDPAVATEVTLEEYVNWLSSTMAAVTANRETVDVKAAYRYGARVGLLQRNPAADIEPPKLVEAEPVVYSNAELSLILCSVRDDLDNVIFHAFVYAGLRRHELVALQWQAVNFERRYMSVRGKGGKLRRVPLHPRLARVLELRRLREPRSQLVLGNGGSLRNVNWRLARLLQRAGVDGGNRPAHRFRKTMATLLYEADVRTDTIDRIMGWAPTSVRQRYYTRIADDALYQAVLTLPDLSARREMAR